MLTQYGKDWIGQENLTAGYAISILLFNQDADNLDESSDIGAITTEPGDGNYTRQTANTARVVDGDKRIYRPDADNTFDTLNCTSQEVTHWGIVADANLPADSSITTHLMAFGALKQTYDVANYNSIPMNATDCGFKF